MPGPLDRIDDPALWRRWRSAGAAGAPAAEPDPVLLAAYAEDRLSPEAAEAIEDWLAANPAAIQDILTARRAQDAPLPGAPQATVARATALVGSGTADVLPFRRPTQRSWRLAANWSAMAASILVACFMGVAMGHATYTVLASGSVDSLGQDLIDPPMGYLSNFDEDSST
jgi:hypothetical protein